MNSLSSLLTRWLKPTEGKAQPSHDIQLEALEPRVLFSAAPVEAPAEESDGTAETAALTQDQVTTIADAAKERWVESGISEAQLDALDAATYVIADLGGNKLGAAEGATITIDDDAAGIGWFVDGTPDQDEEFDHTGRAITGSEASGRIDLVSLILHEQGHLLGLDDDAAAGGVMRGILGESERTLPSPDQAEGAVPGSIDGVRFAATLTWDGGGGDGLLTTASNWNPDQAPAAGDTLNIGGGATVTHSANLEANLVINLTGNSTLQNTGGAIRLDGATIDVESGSTLTGDFWDLNNGTLTFEDGASFTASNWEHKGTNVFTFELGSTGFTALTPGNLNSNGAVSTTYQVDMANYTGGSGVITLVDFGGDSTGLTDATFTGGGQYTLSVVNANGRDASLRWNDPDNAVELVILPAVDDTDTTDEDTILSVAVPGVLDNDGTRENLAAGARYSYSTLPGFSGGTHYFDDAHVQSTGVFDTGDLTDGATHPGGAPTGVGTTVVAWDPATVTSDIVFDLGAQSLVTDLVVGTYVYSPFAVGAPDNVTISFSSDNVTFTGAESATITSTGSGHFDTAVDVTDTSARYVKLSFDGGTTQGDKWMLDEISIFGKAATVSGIQGSSSLSGTSDLGAAVTATSGGGFVYDPTTSTALQALAAGESTTDTFTYTTRIAVPGLLAGSHSPTNWQTVANPGNLGSSELGPLGMIRDGVLGDIREEHWTAPKADGGTGPNNTALIYTGQIFLKVGTWTFAEQNDDNTYLRIDSLNVINAGTWNNSNRGSFNATVDDGSGGGWYDFDARFNNGGGGYGFFGQQDTGAGDSNWDQIGNSDTDPDGISGFRFAMGDPGDENALSYLDALDPGNGSLFRHFIEDTATVTVTVNGVNDAPVAVDDAFDASEDSASSGSVFPGRFDTAVTGKAAFDPAYSGMTATGNVSVSGGVLSLDSGESVSLGNLTGDYTLSLDIGSPQSGGSGNIGVTIGQNTILFHPGFTPIPGAFRVEGPGGFSNQDMGFVPAANVLHHLKITVDSATGEFDISVTDGSDPSNVYRTSFTNPGSVGGEVTLRTSNRTALFDNVGGPGVSDFDPDVDGSTPDDAITVFASDSLSALGATVTVNADGSFTYDPTTSATLQALDQGALITDSFTYKITDSPGVVAGPFNWDFYTGSGGTLAGWTILNGSEVYRSGYGGGINANPTGTGYNYVDDNSHATFLIESPEFVFNGSTLDGTNVLSVQMGGGAGNQNNTEAPTSPSDVLTFNGGQAATNGQKGLALLNTTTGDYDAVLFKSGNGGNPTVNYTIADLQGLGVDTDATYKLQFFENDFGGWGWTQLNFVDVAGSQPPTGEVSAPATVQITVSGTNDAPIANNDGVSIDEKVDDVTDGTVGGNVLTNDSDADDPNSAFTVTEVDGNAGNVGTSVTGMYGSLVLNSNGTYTYTLDNGNATVQALLTTQSLTESFTYRMSDNHSGGNAKTDTATLTITINGANDSPVAMNNTAEVTEDIDLTDSGNVITDDDGSGADSDVDGPTLRVVSVANGATVTDPATDVTGTYGTLNWDTDGSYTYSLDNANAAVQALNPGQSLTETFTYTLNDSFVEGDGLMNVQVVNTSGPNPGTDTNNWLNLWTALDGGAGPTGTVAGFNIQNNNSDTEVRFDYGGGNGSFPGITSINTINGDGPGGSGGSFNGGSNYSIRARSFLAFNIGGTYTIAMGSDDGRRIELTEASTDSAPGFSGFTGRHGQVNGGFTSGDTVVGYSGGTGHQWSLATFTVAAGDILALDAFYYEGGGGDSGEIAIASGTRTGFNTTDFQLLSDGSLGIALDSTNSFTPTPTDTATLTVTINGGPTTGVSVDSGGVLRIEDVDPINTDDDLTISFDAGTNEYVITDAVDGHITRIAAGSVTSIVIEGTGGNDRVTLDYSNGLAAPVTFNGGAGNDDLVVTGGAFGIVTHDHTGADSGTLNLDSAGGVEITYTGLEPVDMTGSTATDFIFNLPDVDNTAELVDLGGGNLRLVSTDTVPTFEQTDFALPSGSITINGGSEEDRLTLPDALTLNGALTIVSENIDLNNDVTAGGDVEFDGTTRLGASVTIDTSAANGDITFDGTVIATGAGGQDLTLNAGTGDVNFNDAVTRGAVAESGGVVVIEAEHYTGREARPSGGNTNWEFVPGESGSFPAGPFANFRGDGYLQALPNGGGTNGATNPPEVRYEVLITTPGTYRLSSRFTGYDGGSDSMFMDIVELKDGSGGTIADHYEYVQSGTNNSNFGSPAWISTGGFELNTANGTPKVDTDFVISTPGIYTVRATVREDGSALDAFVLQLNTFANPTGTGPAESARGPRLGTIQVVNANDVDAATIFDAEGFHQVGGQGTTTFNGAVTIGDEGFIVQEGDVHVNADLEVTGDTRIGLVDATGGGDASVTVVGGDVSLGDGDDVLDVGRRDTNSGTSTNAVFDLSAAGDVTLDATDLRLGTRNNTNTSSIHHGDLLLSTAGTNTVTAGTIQLGEVSPSGGYNTSYTNELVLGDTTNTFNIDTFSIGGPKSNGRVDFNGTGGTLDLSGNSGSETDLLVGNNAADTGANVVGILDLTGGTFNATLDAVVIGRHDSLAGSSDGTLTMDAGTVTANTLTLAIDNGTNPQNSEARLVQRGGTFTVANGVTDGNGVSRLNIEGGLFEVTTGGIDVDIVNVTGGTVTVTAGGMTVEDLNADRGTVTIQDGGLTVDDLRVGYGGTATLTVNAGDVVIGDGNGNLDIGRRFGSNSLGTADFGSASSVTIDVTNVRLGSEVNPGQNEGNLTLSAAGTNTVTASTVAIGRTNSGNNQSNFSDLHLGGAANNFNVNTMTIGDIKSAGRVDIVAGGTFTLNGRAGAGTQTDLRIGYNNSSGTGTNPQLSSLDLTGGTFNATLDDLIIGLHPSGNGSGKGTLIFEAGTVTTDGITIASDAGNNPANTQGTISFDGDVLDLMGADVVTNRGVPTFNFTGGRLKDVDDFGFDLTQQGGFLQIGPDGNVIDTMTVQGNYAQQAGATLEIDLSGIANDTLNVTGNVDVAGDLDIIFGGTPVVAGTTYTLIDNQGAGTTTGQFNGLAEGSIISLSSGGMNPVPTTLLRISYMGGDGNDVVLVASPEDATSDIMLDGSGNLVISDIAGDDSDDNLTIRVDGTEVVISDPDNVLGTLINGATQTQFNEVRVDTSLFTGDIIINTLGGDDTITIGDLGNGVLPGGITVDGGGGFDYIQYNGVGSVLGGTASASFTGEEIVFWVGSDLSTTDGDITATGTGGSGANFHGVHLFDADLTAGGTGNVTLTGQGGDTGNSNNGVFLSNGSSVTTNDGDIDIDGTGGGTGVAGKGVMVYSGSSLSAGGSGNLTIDGTGATGGTLQGEGVFFNSGTSASVVDGDMTINGTGNGSGGLALGVSITNTTLTATGSGNITVNGTSNGSGGSGNSGVQLWSTDVDTTAGSGSVTVSGTASASGTSSNMGVRLSDVDIDTGGDGSIDIDGTGAGSGANNIGVQLSADANLTVQGTGTLTIDGTAGSGTSNNLGIELGNDSDLQVENGSLTLTGTGNGSAGLGIGISAANSDLTGTGSGNITINGTSAASGGFGNSGVQFNGTDIDTSTGSGSVTISGSASANGTFNNVGVRLANSDITTGADGSIDIDGTGAGSATGNTGVALLNGSALSAAGTGTLTIDGSGGAGTSFNHGVMLSGATTSVSSVNGATTINGTANGSLHFNRGIDVTSATITTTGSGILTVNGTGSASSTGFFNSGINLLLANISTTSAAMNMTGNGGAGNLFNQGVRSISSSIDSGGILTLRGTAIGAAGGLFNSGIYLVGGTLNGAGGTTIEGTGGAGSALNHGVYILAVGTSTLSDGNVTGTATDGVTDDEFVLFV